MLDEAINEATKEIKLNNAIIIRWVAEIIITNKSLF